MIWLNPLDCNHIACTTGSNDAVRRWFFESRLSAPTKWGLVSPRPKIFTFNPKWKFRITFERRLTKRVSRPLFQNWSHRIEWWPRFLPTSAISPFAETTSGQVLENHKISKTRKRKWMDGFWIKTKNNFGSAYRMTILLSRQFPLRVCFLQQLNELNSRKQWEKDEEYARNISSKPGSPCRMVILHTLSGATKP